MLETFRRLGGLTQILKTDNMTAIVSLRNGNRKIHSRVQSFFNDLGVKLELCECRTPETKGKCESSNRFVNWLVSLIIESKMSRNLSISLKTRSHLSAIRKSTGVQKYRLPSCFLRKRNSLNRLETI